MSTRPSLVSVIQVTYNSAAFAVSSLESAVEAAQWAGVEHELIVVDNASADGTSGLVRRRWPHATVVANRENVGFARANNQAFERATGDLLLLLNPDALLAPAALATLVAFLGDHPAAGAVAPALDAPWPGGPEGAGMAPGVRSTIGHYLFVNRLLPGDAGGPWRGVMLQQRRHLGPRRADWLSGAVLLARAEAVRAAGGFDPSYFLYSEDVDFGARLRGAGWELWTVPAARALHVKAGSQGRVSTRWVDAAHDHYARGAGAAAVLVHDLVMAAGMSARALPLALGDRTAEGRIRARTVSSSARRAWYLTGRTAARLARGRVP